VNLPRAAWDNETFDHLLSLVDDARNMGRVAAAIKGSVRDGRDQN